VCAGTDEQVTREDVLFCGAVAARLRETLGRHATLNDEAELAAAAWRDATPPRTSEPLAAVLRKSRGGRNLVSSGQSADIDAAAAVDAYRIVPRFDAASGEIRAR